MGVRDLKVGDYVVENLRVWSLEIVGISVSQGSHSLLCSIHIVYALVLVLMPSKMSDDVAHYIRNQIMSCPSSNFQLIVTESGSAKGGTIRRMAKSGKSHLSEG